jgi:hypothetical protein
MQPSQLLITHRPEDIGNDVWRTYNVIQENLLRGGLARRVNGGRLTRSRRISSIPENVRLNTGMWDLAERALAA